MYHNPVLYREVSLLRRKLLRPGYVFSTIFFPLIYLAAFGLGLGHRVQLEGGGSYVQFLLPGIVAMASMTNAFNLSANSTGMGRLLTRHWQSLLISPASPMVLIWGYIMAGALRGLLAAFLVALAGILLFGIFPFTFFSLLSLLLNVTLFAALGLLVGVFINDIEDMALFTNFIIMPMAFFSGTFFPLDGMPSAVVSLLSLLPLTHINAIMRAQEFSMTIIFSLAYSTLLLGIILLWCRSVVHRYHE
ncbi:ABC transporter permease [Desulfurispira natronophila]|uniref:Transport permease protein n=1 Tax=Desulfurispira natronophila TaxID=682562 RepID=A0A7W7Y3R3_9BACT|nr:ABC transporter permease [Desulfurispira natronophila]MBB5021530.1 ABC-type multidrug transport system permease subunit [Desulfurispira natronophila]